MAEGNGNGGVRITATMLLTALTTLVFLWAAYVTNEAIASRKEADAAHARIDGVVRLIADMCRAPLPGKVP